MEITELNDKLVKDFFEIVHRTMEEIHIHPEYSLSKNNHHLFSPEGKYANAVFGIYAKINEIKEDLSKVEVFLRRFPLKKFYEENEISHLDYIKYHTEVFYHKCNTLLDLFKLFTNEVYELGYSERKCTWGNLMKSEAVKDSLSLKVIEYYHKSFEHIIKARNLNTHRGIFKDSEKDDIEAPMMIYKNSEKFNMELGDDFRRMMPKFLLEYKLKKYKNERLLYIKSGNNSAEQYINIFINVTIPEFLNRAKAKQ
ncbi:Cthe_2314 family HEPN domain-containing protein [Flavobacterium sharifuzzamanii]|uniref:Cthe_2314 family HEPN domain-containing protein n=1 Tax=Flavobacterium sharifuzzamanii TaxID=2211133 RepID=UPI000DAF1F63|nr:Cthe_2314 family HEPN domain-containing protein [Flavobacterium sharifuzzamanii]KAF2082055.1 hypothetical protein DMA14_06180 [Flavobacterium sharifuzzamanii]